MWFPGSSRRLLYVYVVVLILVLLQMVGAIRVFPGNAVANNVGFSHRIMDNESKLHQDLFNKYFSGRRTFGPTSSNTTQTGFDESKRRVPSCPDPLHN